MSKRDTTEAIIDGILRLGVTSGALAAGLVIPNLLVALDKPLGLFWKQLDKRERERELRRVVSYMKTSRLISGDYKHGLEVTDKGKARLAKTEFDNLEVKTTPEWDGRWRLVIYDIPEEFKVGRQSLTAKLNKLGFYQLQRSAWLHPLPCRDVIETVTVHYKINKFVSYMETDFIDNQKVLVDKFKKKYPSMSF